MIEKIDLKLLNFTNEAEEQQAVLDLEQGLKSPFWLFISKILDQNIVMIREKLETEQGMSGEDNDYLKQRLQDLKKLRSIPETQLEAMRPRPVSPDFDEHDPYEQSPKSSKE